MYTPFVYNSKTESHNCVSCDLEDAIDCGAIEGNWTGGWELANVKLNPGYWRASANVDEFRVCHNKEACSGGVHPAADNTTTVDDATTRRLSTSSADSYCADGRLRGGALGCVML